MKREFIALSVLIGLLAIGLIAWKSAPSASANPAPETLAPATPLLADSAPTESTTSRATDGATEVTTDELSLGINGVGEIKAAQDADLVFTVQGTIDDVKVQEGDVVTQGQLLAILDTRPFDQQVEQAQAALDAAKAQQAALGETPRAADIRAANVQVRQAEVALAQSRTGQDQDIKTAAAALDLARTNVQATRDKLSLAKTQADTQAQQAAQALTQAQARYAQAKSTWEYVRDTGKDPALPDVKNLPAGTKIDVNASEPARASYYAQFVQAEAAMKQAEEAMQLALANAETARQAEISGIQAAEQQVVQAQAALDRLRVPADQDRVAAAQAALDLARANRARLNPDPRPSQQNLAAAGAAQAQAALDRAKLNREYAELRAPFDGIAAVVNIDPGDPSAVPGKPAITLVDISRLRVEVQISDVDIARVAVGEQARVELDGLPDKPYTGTVSYIAPTPTVAGNIRTYLVRVLLDNPAGLRVGMSARVELPAR